MDLTGPQLVALHNELAARLGVRPVARFATRVAGARRVAALQAQLSPKAAKGGRARGCNLAPRGEARAAKAGSKRATLVDILARPEGATLADIIAAMAAWGTPWAPQTARAGLGWDVNKMLGYGITTVFDADGTQRFRLVLPAGLAEPLAHRA